MARKRRMIFGVVGAEVNSIEQREIIKGIVEQAQAYNVDTAVISNIYNPNSSDAEIYSENKIYDLILSPEFDALILISESFVNSELQQLIKQYFLKKNSVPVVVIGTALPGFVIPNCKYINTSDEDDIEDITNHLIEEHGFTDIDILTGYDFVEASLLRVSGYRRALERHGIPFDERKVHYGNFWLNSGEELAQRYISGELPYPEAIVCANDYMAYGMLDEFAENKIAVPDTVSVIGYEYVRERHMHTPLLTTYQRNRVQLGKSAVQILFSKIIHNIDERFIPPKGNLIQGISCPCSISKVQLHTELKSARIKQRYDTWNLFGQMEQRLTECSTLDELVENTGNFQYLIRFVQNIYMCLYDKWFSNKCETQDDAITCRSIMPWFDSTPFSTSKYSISEIFIQNPVPSVYYFSPLFFRDRVFGHVVLKYDYPDTYDDVFRNWMKSVSNGLEFLRMKNDIRYFMQARNLSENHDAKMNMYNEKGLEKAYNCMIADSETDDIYAVMLEVCMNDKDDFSDENKKNKYACLSAIAEDIRKFSDKKGVCGRIDETTFLCFEKRANISAELLADKMESAVIFDQNYMKRYGMDTYICIAVKLGDSFSFDDALQACRNKAEIQREIFSERLMLPYYTKLLQIKNFIYRNPRNSYSIDELGKQHLMSPSYLRKKYKECFGISFHQDCINSRVAMSKSLLVNSTNNIVAVAEKCGYADNKYFMRQFMLSTGFTPNKYRELLS